jgi:environmental stress-induced protein Ves
MSAPPRLTPLDPAGFGRAPWKNGGGVTLDIATAQRPGGSGGWDGVIWRFGRTAIVSEAPFSDLSGYDRWQVVVSGAGLVLETPSAPIDLREAFRPVTYDGGLPIRSRLEQGPVEVVNLIGDRLLVATALAVPAIGETTTLPAGLHIAYAPAEAAAMTLDGRRTALPAGHALRIEADGATAFAVEAGRVLVASILPRG